LQANLVKLAYEGHTITIRDDGWFNATEAASKFGREPITWIRQRESVEYIATLASTLGKSDFLPEFNKINELDGISAISRSRLVQLVKKTGLVVAKSGSPENGGGTWLHPKLAVAFARWLDVKFAIWCDLQIDNLIRNKQTWAQQRHAATSGAKMLAMVLEEKRKRDGKETAAYHYMNEHLMLNELVTGERKGCDRDSASSDTLDALAKLQIQDSMLILDSIGYGQRKELLQTAVKALPSYKLLPAAQAIPAKQSKQLKARKAANADKMQ